MNSTTRTNLDELNTEIYSTRDIVALITLVMMQEAKSNNEELKAIMNEMKKINKAKQKLRKLMSELAKKSLLNNRKDLSDNQKLILIKYIIGPCQENSF